MGWISERAHRRGHGLNSSGKNGSGNGPLRAIVCKIAHPDFPSCAPIVQVLECGHYIRQASDLFGATDPKRRRCSMCRDGKPALWDAAQLSKWKEEVK